MLHMHLAKLHSTGLHSNSWSIAAEVGQTEEILAVYENLKLGYVNLKVYYTLWMHS